MTSQRFVRLASLLCAALLLGGFVPCETTRAESGTPAAIIATVNALRAARGLAPYQVDAGLMAYAQEHSDYQAAIHTSTHLHSDGMVPQEHGLQENVAGGDLDYLTPDAAVYEIWADAGHMKTMVGYTSGWIGAGAANDGQTEYYTIDVRPGNAPAVKPGKGTPSATPTKPIPVVPLVTMTSRAIGCTIHLVGYGQSLWTIAIAYGVKINDIRGLNGIPAGSTDIYAGEKLVIRCVPVTATAPVTETPEPTSIPVTALQADTPTDAPAIAMADILPTIPATVVGADQKTQGARGEAESGLPAGLVAGLLILTVGTLLVVLAFSMVKGNAITK